MLEEPLIRLDPKSYFILMAKVAALRSTCNSRQNGAVIVKDRRIICTGYNGTIPGKPQCSDKGPGFCYRRAIGGPERDKYNICPAIHAEANALNQAAKYGISVDGSDCYCTLAPCYICLKNLAACGIRKVFYELAYESSDKERDRLWADFDKVGIEGQEITLSQDILDFSFAKLKEKSSIRRLEAK